MVCVGSVVPVGENEPDLSKGQWSHAWLNTFTQKVTIKQRIPLWFYQKSVYHHGSNLC